MACDIQPRVLLCTPCMKRESILTHALECYDTRTSHIFSFGFGGDSDAYILITQNTIICSANTSDGGGMMARDKRIAQWMRIMHEYRAEVIPHSVVSLVLRDTPLVLSKILVKETRSSVPPYNICLMSPESE